MRKSSQRAARALLLLLCLVLAPAVRAEGCDGLWSWVSYQCKGLAQAWREPSRADLYLTGWAHHDRGTYSPEKIASFNEKAWGGGLGSSIVNDRGDTFGYYALAFKDSHYNWDFMAGWNWRTYWPATGDYGVGLGYTAFIATRPDVLKGIPFPGVLPLASVKVHRFELIGTYIPKVSQGTTGNGNVAFLFMSIHF